MPSSTSIKKRWEIVFLSTHPFGPQWKNSKIATYTKCSRSVVTKWLQRYEETGEVDELERTGRPSPQIVKTDKLIEKELDKHPEVGSLTIANKLKRKGVEVSDRTVRRRLNVIGLSYGYNLAKPLLSETHRTKRLAWAKENEHTEWDMVLFTDESTINLNMKRKKVWQRPGKRMVIRVVKHPVKVHIWGCVSSQGFGKCYVFTQNLDSKLMEKIYKQALVPSRKLLFGSHSASMLLQEDNDPKHKSKLCTKWKVTNNFTNLPWPANSPDQNCIENAWHVLKLKVAERKPTTLKQLVRTVKKEWASLTTEYAAKLVSSMPRRVQALIDAGGDYTMF
jgi:transposase